MKRAKDLELRVLLDISLGWTPGLTWNGGPNKQQRIDAAIERCVEKGWLTKAKKLTQAGKEAAGLVLKEVPLPPHLRNLIKPGIRTS